MYGKCLIRGSLRPADARAGGRAGDHHGFDCRPRRRRAGSRRARRDRHVHRRRRDRARSRRMPTGASSRRSSRRAPTSQGRAAGFPYPRAHDIDVRLGQRVELTLTMQVGGLNESVNVKGAAPIVDRRRPRPAPCSTASRCSSSRSAGASATRCISRPASAAADKSARPTPRVGRQRPREQLRPRRRQHHQRRLRRARLLLDRLRVAGQRHAVRLHPGDTGQDRRLRGRVRPGHRRRRQCRHQERLEHAARQRVRLLPDGGAGERDDQVTTSMAPST